MKKLARRSVSRSLICWPYGSVSKMEVQSMVYIVNKTNNNTCQEFFEGISELR